MFNNKIMYQIVPTLLIIKFFQELNTVTYIVTMFDHDCYNKYGC